MSIEAYFQEIQNSIATCFVVQSSNIRYDKRTLHTGFIQGELYFADDSVLHIREFVDTENGVDCLMYVYHYMDNQNNLVFRYDNTGHHKGLPNYPHHKHVGSQNNVISTNAPNLAEVLVEIEQSLE